MTPHSDFPDAQPVYDACIDAALSHAGSLMRGLVAAVRDVLYQQSRQQLPVVGAGILSEARSLLGRHGAALVADFPDSLCAAMAGVGRRPAAASGPDGIALVAVDEQPPALARAQQALGHAVEETLPLFTALICATQGLPAVDADRNPLLPEVYVRALHIAVDRTGASAAVRAIWMEHLYTALGPQLASEYTHLSDALLAAGVEPAPAEALAPSMHAVSGRVVGGLETAADGYDLQDGLSVAADPVEAPVDAAVLARRISAEIAAWPESLEVPAPVREFVLGPWSEVIAESQRSAGDGPLDRDGYYALVRPLLWSARPELGRSDVERLVQLVPSLLSRLRAGLRTIDFPHDAEEAFFSMLGELHRIAARAPGSSFNRRQQAREGAGPEGRSSGHGASPLPVGTQVAPAAVPAAAADVLSAGAWMESLVRGHWVRLQLSWVSPQRSLLLFTADDGTTESMTRRACLQRMAERRLRILPDLDLDLSIG